MALRSNIFSHDAVLYPQSAIRNQFNSNEIVKINGFSSTESYTVFLFPYEYELLISTSGDDPRYNGYPGLSGALQNEKFFVPSLEEIDKYGVFASRVLYRNSSFTSPWEAGELSYWLRTPSGEGRESLTIDASGSVVDQSLDQEEIYPRYAGNLDISKVYGAVLYPELQVTGLEKDASFFKNTGTLFPVGSSTKNKVREYGGYSLFIIDNQRTSFTYSVESSSDSIKPGSKITVNYSGASYTSQDRYRSPIYPNYEEYISVFIQDEQGKVVYFGPIEKPASDQRSATFVIPRDIASGRYTISVMNNAGSYFDGFSMPVGPRASESQDLIFSVTEPSIAGPASMEISADMTAPLLSDAFTLTSIDPQNVNLSVEPAIDPNKLYWDPATQKVIAQPGITPGTYSVTLSAEIAPDKIVTHKLMLTVKASNVSPPISPVTPITPKIHPTEHVRPSEGERIPLAPSESEEENFSTSLDDKSESFGVAYENVLQHTQVTHDGSSKKQIKNHLVTPSSGDETPTFFWLEAFGLSVLVISMRIYFYWKSKRA